MSAQSLPTPDATSGEFYGTRPSELPPTLPKGTRSEAGRVALEDVALVGSEYRGRWTNLGGGEQPGVGAYCINWTTVRRVSPASTREWQPGDRVSAVAWCSGESNRFEGVIRGPYENEEKDPQFADHYWVFREGYLRGAVCPASSLRLLTPSASMPAEQPKGDPYRTNPLTETLPNGKPVCDFEEWAARQNQKHAALVVAHKADLDRGTRSRLVALGGRNGKLVSLANLNWPEADEGEP